MAQPESKLSRAIMAALRNRGIWCVKIHGGPFTMAGTPDILACVPVYDFGDGSLNPPTGMSGLFVGFETKTPSGGDPSPVQVHQHNKIRESCGVVIVPRSVQDAVEAIEALGYIRPPTMPG